MRFFFSVSIFDSLRRRQIGKENKACKLRFDPVARFPKKKWHAADSHRQTSPGHRKSSVWTTTWPNFSSVRSRMALKMRPKLSIMTEI